MSNKVREYQGQGITVTYQVERCIHAEKCVHGLPQVFNPKQRPWIQADHAEADELAAVVMQCPTGALKFSRQDGGTEEVAPSENLITLEVNGPLYVSGEVEIRQKDGTVLFTETRLALCRCGASQNKPFCDNRHVERGFHDKATLVGASPKPEDAADLDGKLRLTPRPNGPMLFQGQVEIRSHDGQTTMHLTKGALCRCGASLNKPFCDGTHNAIGFQAE